VLGGVIDRGVADGVVRARVDGERGGGEGPGLLRFGGVVQRGLVGREGGSSGVRQRALRCGGCGGAALMVLGAGRLGRAGVGAGGGGRGGGVRGGGRGGRGGGGGAGVPRVGGGVPGGVLGGGGGDQWGQTSRTPLWRVWSVDANDAGGESAGCRRCGCCA